VKLRELVGGELLRAIERLTRRTFTSGLNAFALQSVFVTTLIVRANGTLIEK